MPAPSLGRCSKREHFHGKQSTSFIIADAQGLSCLLKSTRREQPSRLCVCCMLHAAVSAQYVDRACCMHTAVLGAGAGAAAGLASAGYMAKTPLAQGSRTHIGLLARSCVKSPRAYLAQLQIYQSAHLPSTLGSLPSLSDRGTPVQSISAGGNAANDALQHLRLTQCWAAVGGTPPWFGTRFGYKWTQ